VIRQNMETGEKAPDTAYVLVFGIISIGRGGAVEEMARR
jgi:hypothetical protein